MHIPQNIGTAYALATVVLALFATSALAAPTDFDTGFGKNGKSLTDAGGDENAQDVFTQPDGKTVVVGYTSNGGASGTTDALLYRLDPDGSLDDSLGIRTLDLGANTEFGTAGAVQDDGKIIVAGWTSKNDDAVVFRRTATGKPDTDFGDGGTATIDSGGMERIEDVAIQPDGKIVLVGHTSVNDDIAVYRLTQDGKLDPSFDGDGARGLDSGSSDWGDAVAVQPDGKILVSGRAGTLGASVYRLDEDGSTDASFSGGRVTVVNAYAHAYDLALQPDGRIVVLASRFASDWDTVVTRLLPDGKPDKSFHDDGTLSIDTGSSDYPATIGLQPDGKIVVGGGVDAGNDALLIRIDRDGTRDATFGEDGVHVFSAGGIGDSAVSSVAADGKILVAESNNATNSDALVIRFKGGFTEPGGGGQPGGGEQPGGGDGGQPGDGEQPGGGDGGGQEPGGSGQDPKPKLCNGLRVTIAGTAKSDRIKGTAGRDVIAGLGGRDVVTALDGNDVVCGGKGNDVIRGGKGRDVLIGGAGRDRLIGGPGKDTTRQ